MTRRPTATRPSAGHASARRTRRAPPARRTPASLLSSLIWCDLTFPAIEPRRQSSPLGAGAGPRTKAVPEVGKFVGLYPSQASQRRHADVPSFTVALSGRDLLHHQGKESAGRVRRWHAGHAGDCRILTEAELCQRRLLGALLGSWGSPRPLSHAKAPTCCGAEKDRTERRTNPRGQCKISELFELNIPAAKKVLRHRSAASTGPPGDRLPSTACGCHNGPTKPSRRAGA